MNGEMSWMNECVEEDALEDDSEDDDVKMLCRRNVDRIVTSKRYLALLSKEWHRKAVRLCWGFSVWSKVIEGVHCIWRNGMNILLRECGRAGVDRRSKGLATSCNGERERKRRAKSQDKDRFIQKNEQHQKDKDWLRVPSFYTYDSLWDFLDILEIFLFSRISLNVHHLSSWHHSPLRTSFVHETYRSVLVLVLCIMKEDDGYHHVHHASCWKLLEGLPLFPMSMAAAKPNGGWRLDWVCCSRLAQRWSRDVMLQIVLQKIEWRTLPNHKAIA